MNSSFKEAVMTIKEVAEKYDITQDTLRYYERVGVIPPIGRTSGGIRDYNQNDLNWIEHAICMRSAGLPIESIIEYQKLFQQGDETVQARLDLLSDQLEILKEQQAQIEQTIARLEYKVSRYKIAVETGVLSWEHDE